jgi:Putative Flp pilus-assembly TadE/G-like
MRGKIGRLRGLLGDRRGSISVLSAFVLVGVIGVSALALEYGHGLLQKTENQRVADLAAYAGALVYNSTSSTASAESAANNVAALNGLSGDATPTVVTSPTGDGNQAMQVTVTSNVPLLLARVLTSNTTMAVSATAYAEMKSNAPACVVALSGSGSGVALTGGATLSATGCTVASNSTVTAHACSNTITTPIVDYDAGTPPTCSLVPPAGKSSVQTNKTTTADPLAGNSQVSTATARISTVSAIASPSAPVVAGGTAVSFGYSKVTTLPSGCTDSFSSPIHTVTCTSGSTYTFGKITLSGGITVNFNTSGSSSTIYKFSSDIDASGGATALSFGPGTYDIAGGIIATGSLPMTFGAGTFNIGTATSTSNCGGTSGYSICIGGSARVIFGGPSAFVLAGGIYQDASGMPSTPALSFGYGTTTNSFNIGKSSNGYSLNDANGATLFGDATGSGDLFQMAGNLTTTGGSCVAVSAAAEHDINGSINGSGGIVLGSGIYTINGYVALGNSSGGNVSNCPTSGATTGLSALGVTLVISGASTVSCGSTTSAFCLGAGYSTVDLTAPTSSSSLGSSTAGLAVIGPQSSSNTATASFTSGATNTRISGAFYFPNGQVYMDGGATLHDTVDTGACLELIGSEVTLNAGSTVGSTCTGLGGGSTGATVALVQ